MRFILVVLFQQHSHYSTVLAMAAQKINDIYVAQSFKMMMLIDDGNDDYDDVDHRQ